MLDVGNLALKPGDVRRLRVPVAIDPLQFGGERYEVVADPEGADVELQAMVGGLYLKLRFEATVAGPCYRCLEEASVTVKVSATEYQEQGADPLDDELGCEYLDGDELDVDRWARDALVLALPGKILCQPDCAGLCPRCGVRLEPGVDHDCAPHETDSRWDALRGLLE
ncbi:MAG TPA: YceD family protein [Gaiellales bacterium]